MAVSPNISNNIKISDMSTHKDPKTIDGGGYLAPQLCFNTEWHVDVDLLTPDEFIKEFELKEFMGSGHDTIVPNYVHALTYKYPDLKVIEIDSGPRSCASRIFERLRNHPEIGVPGLRFGEYHISETSNELLDISREKLKDLKDSVLFRELDFRKDLATQGIVESHYDLALITIHGNHDNKTVLRQVRKLLKPNGQLIILYQAEQLLENHTSNWNDLLGQDGGFGRKIQCSVQHDPHAANHSHSFILAAVAEEEHDLSKQSIQPPAMLFFEPRQGSRILDFIEARMKHQITSASISRVSIDQIPDTTGNICIFLIESEEPFLSSISETQWDNIRQATFKAKDVLWIGRGGAIDSPSPENNLAVGLGRTIRTERPHSRFITLDLDVDDTPEEAAKAISKVLHHTMMRQVRSKENQDSEYAVRGGRILIPRIIPNPQMNNYVQQDLTAKYPLNLDEDAAYLLVGGLGGLGRSLSVWMASKGAKHLIFLSRSGTEKSESRQTVDELKSMGVHVTVSRCDVGDSASLETTIQQVRRDSPPIKGIIHGGMVLHNSTFTKMSYDAWKQTLHPKVHGTKNLCHAFSAKDATPLDFFIILSSAIGMIGNFGQGNYAAASTYQDAVAHHHHDLSAIGSGMPIITIDVGMILGVGYVAENSAAAARLKKLGITGIQHEKFISIVKAIIVDTIRRRRPSCRQIITGLGTQAMMDGGAAKGNDDEVGESKLPFYFQDPKFSHLLQLHHSFKDMAAAGGTEDGS